MTLTFVAVGVSYLATALALRPAAATGRLILMAGAVAGMLVAANPEHPGDAYPVPHIIAASAGFAGLSPGPPEPGGAGPGCPGFFGPPCP